MAFARIVGAESDYITRRDESIAARLEEREVDGARQEANAQLLKTRRSAWKRRESISVSQKGRARSVPLQSHAVQLPPISAQEVQGLVAQMQAQPARALTTQTLNMSRDAAIGLLSGG